MVIDTSAILAWLKQEPERERIIADRAQLNFGDCAVYALAKSLDEPLLFVGNDFSQTDIEQC